MMESPPFDSTHARQRRAWHEITALGLHTRSAMSGVECHHRFWAAHTVERRWAWYAIIALGRQTWSNNVRRDMPSPPLDNSNGRTTSGVESHHRLWNSSHYRTASAVACHHRPWATHAVERRRAWHDITAFGHHTRLDDVGRDITSLPLGCTHS